MALDAELYHQNSKIQKTLADELLEKVNLSGTECLADLGCGDGTITAKLAHQTQSALGIDPSSDMIQLARQLHQQPNLSFAEGSYEKLSAPLDLVTAFSCLHWIPNQSDCFAAIRSALVKGGKFVGLTFPKESTYWQPFVKVLNQPQWLTFPNITPHWLSTEQYHALFQSLAFETPHFVASECHVHYQNSEQLRDYIKGWLPCMIQLPQALENEFLDQVMTIFTESFNYNFNEYHIPYTKLEIIAML